MGWPRCCRKACSDPALWQVGFSVWPEGRRKSDHAPLQSFSSCHFVCEAHKSGAAAITLDEVLLPDARTRLEQFLRSFNKAPADFATAEVAFRAIMDEVPLPDWMRGRLH